MSERKKQEDERRMREAEEKKQKEQDAKLHRLEEAERKRQLMMQAQKASLAGKNFLTKKADGGGVSRN